MTWIKICGITNLEDAHMAVEAGADALGFVFHEKSPRNIGPDTARDIVTQLPVAVDKVGVFVEGSAERIREMAEHVRLTAVQIHTSKVSGPVYDPFGKKGTGTDLKFILALPADELVGKDFMIKIERGGLYAILLDSGSSSSPGGTGNRFDWSKAYDTAQALGMLVPVIIAGGLDPCNVAEAVKLFRPYGVDVASGVEAKPGKKDVQKVKAFVKAVREAGKTS